MALSHSAAVEDCWPSLGRSRESRARTVQGRRSRVPTHQGGGNETQVEALIRLELACQLALAALPSLPTETEQTLLGPVQTLCQVTGRELDRVSPGWRDSPIPFEKTSSERVAASRPG